MLNTPFWECLHCQKVLQDRQQIGNHRRQCEKGDFIDIAPDYQVVMFCDFCKVVCCESNYQLLKRHMDEVHGPAAKAKSIVYRLEEHNREEKDDPTFEPHQEAPRRKPKASQPPAVREEDSYLAQEDDPHREEEEESEAEEVTEAKKLGCFFCKRSYESTNTLKRHFRTVHKLTDGKFIAVLQKLHLFQDHKMRESSKKSTKRFLCRTCMSIKDRAVKHTCSHKESLIVLRSIYDMPQEFMARVYDASKENTDPLSALKNINGINFQKLVEEYTQVKLQEFAQNQQRSWTDQNTEFKKRRLGEMIVESKGLSDFVALKTWMNNKEEFKSGKTIQNQLNELLVFTEQFIALKSSLYKRINIFQVVASLKHMKKLQSSSVRARRIVQQMVTSQRLPSFEVASSTRDRVFDHAKSTLEELEKFEKKLLSSRPAKFLFRKLQYALIALFVFRNGCRNGTVLNLRAGYLKYCWFDEKTNLLGFKMAPNVLEGAEPPSGQLSDFINTITSQLTVTNKNFAVHGTKVQCLHPEEMLLFQRFIKLRLLLKFEADSLLFAPRKSVQNSYEEVKSRMKSWSARLPKTIGKVMTGTDFRKVTTSYFAQTIKDFKVMVALDEQIGHTRAVSAQHYQVATDKMNAAFLTSSLIGQKFRGSEVETSGSSSIAETPGPSNVNMLRLPAIRECPETDVSLDSAGDPDFEASPERGGGSSSENESNLEDGQKRKKRRKVQSCHYDEKSLASVKREALEFLNTSVAKVSGRRTILEKEDLPFVAEMFAKSTQMGPTFNLRKPCREYRDNDRFYEAVRSKLKLLAKNFNLQN